MRYRIQPKGIDIPEDDPFKGDLLERREPAEIITAMLRSVDGPCVLSVDAPWGAGKTTFLRMLAHHLRNEGFPVIEFNAWETDFAGDPFVALSEELTAGLREYAAATRGEGVNRIKLYKLRKVAKEVLRRAAPGAIRVVTAGILDVSPLMEKEVGQALGAYAQQRLSAYGDMRASVRTFRTSLGELANELSDANHGRPLVVVIDELDRCRPSYAVELLETAKHLFSVDQVVFVLAVNRDEIAHSIRALYGSGFDAAGYLRRFFDIDFRLPDAERRPFMETTLGRVGIDDDIVRNWLLAFFDTPDFSLRRISQSIHRLGLVFPSLETEWRTLAFTLAFVMRTLDADRCRAFVQGDVEDREVVEFLRDRASRLTSHQLDLLEAVVIVAAMEICEPNGYWEFAVGSALLKEYKAQVDQAESHGPTGDETAHARSIVNQVQRICRMERLSNVLGFREAVQRIELLSPFAPDETENAFGGRHD